MNYQQGSNFQAQQQTQEPKKLDFESTVLQLLQQQQQTSNQQGQAIQKLEMQLGQIANELSERKKGEFRSQAIPNPRGQEEVKAITLLKNGKVVDNKVGANEEESGYEIVGASPTKEMASKNVSEKKKVIVPPFPQKLVKQKKEQHLLDNFETLRKVEINIPLLDAIEQIPSYAKFLKDCCTHKRKFQEHEKVALTEEVRFCCESYLLS